MALKLYGEKENPSTWKILIAAKYNDVKIETPAFNVGVDNKSQEFLEKSPAGKIPVLETPNGSIFETNAIARYVARQGKNVLYGKGAFEAGLVDQWIDFAVSEIDLPAAVWVYPILGIIGNNPLATQKAKGDVRQALNILNKHLATRTFLVGERISLADIAVATSVLRLYERVLDPAFRKQLVNVNRWFTTVVNQPNFLAVHGEIKLCQKMEVAPDVAEEPKKEVKKEAKKEQKQEKKQEKPKPKKEAEEDEDEFAEKEEKKKNPLDDLPPTKFNLDEWKRTYSNNDTRTVAIPYFWQNYDPSGWSLWFGEYKYNNELEKVFMTANLLGGFVQRLDRLRKYGFGSLIIFGEEPKLSIGLCFLVRGQVLPAEMTECDDCELYNWKKANVDNAGDKELVNDYWAWEGNFGGKKFNQGKMFK